MTMLGWMLVAIAAMSVGATLLTRGTVALMGRFGGEAVQRTMRDIEHVVEHHAVPPSWHARLKQRFGDLRTGSVDSPRRERSRTRAHRWCLRELDRLVTFAKKSSVVTDEETRGILLSELAQVREEWLARGWDEMCRPGAGPRGAVPDPGSEG